MYRHWRISLMIVGLGLAGCTTGQSPPTATRYTLKWTDNDYQTWNRYEIKNHEGLQAVDAWVRHNAKAIETARKYHLAIQPREELLAIGKDGHTWPIPLLTSVPLDSSKPSFNQEHKDNLPVDELENLKSIFREYGAPTANVPH